jgi:hypothetical protein
MVVTKSVIIKGFVTVGLKNLAFMDYALKLRGNFYE